MNVVWLLLALAVCAVLLYFGYRIEPHHVSKNGRRFLGTGQWLSNVGDTSGRRREVWVTLQYNGQLQVDVKRRLHHDVTTWWVEGRSPQPPPRRAVYVLRSVDAMGAVQRMTLQVPAKSRIVETLDGLLPKPRSTAPSD